MIGPGEYDQECTDLLFRLRAAGILLAVIGGRRGTGFSVSTTNPHLPGELPSILRQVADEIEADAARLRE